MPLMPQMRCRPAAFPASSNRRDGFSRKLAVGAEHTSVPPS
jgi:hypothetical protein